VRILLRWVHLWRNVVKARGFALKDLQSASADGSVQISPENLLNDILVLTPSRSLMSGAAARLRSLKVQPENLALRIPVYVGPTGTVLHEGHPYSMPPEAISMPGTLYLYADRVRIVAGRFEAVHPRKFMAQEGSTLAEHRAAMVAGQ
jgi:hypothetical protein